MKRKKEDRIRPTATFTDKLSTSIAKEMEKMEDERESWLIKIVEQILSQNLENPRIELDHIKKAIIECMRPENSLKHTETILNVINALDIPKVTYDMERRKFVLEKIGINMYPDATYKSLIFRDRFNILWHRTLKHPMFLAPKLGETSIGRCKLTPIEYLLSESRTINVYVMGLLSQLVEGQYYLEDISGVVKIDLKNAKFQDGLIVDGSIVLANGNYDDNILYVKDIGFPPAEASNISRAPFGDHNTFGGPHPVSLKTSEKLQKHEQNNPDGMIVFVSELWVDSLEVLDKFKIMLVGYAEFPPIAFVLCGQFLSFPPNTTSTQKMKEGFKRLANIVELFENIKKESKFIIVPAPYDLGAPKILPRAPLPKCLVEDFIKTVPGTILATNPCRIQYCTKEIVVLREDMVSRLCRNTLFFPTEGEVYEHYAKSIICQAHLTPMNLPVIPIYWKHDHALQLYPVPDLIVVADQFESYTTEHMECKVMNPGSFPKNNFSFMAYVPAMNNIDICAIPVDTDLMNLDT
ncbi:DNA polymerase epsilon subunit 2 isoform X2 [Cephus cinctus]|uniref:DNA polymerase epsilon subunit n=1 Tax=Cephus cinctus TaxID=211228 RepID=A0AAJ7CGA3_CEPCN|nr:DNA polymerase epsilon subunit 2 isoform X2 [Cephus cinctus]